MYGIIIVPTVMDSPQTLPIATEKTSAQKRAVPLLIRVGQSHRPCRPAPRIIELRPLRRVVLGRGEPESFERQGDTLACTLDDPWMSGRHAQIDHLHTADRRWVVLQDQGSTNGCWVNGARVTRHELCSGDILQTGQTFWKYCDTPPEQIEDTLDLAFKGGEIGHGSTVSPLLLEQLRRIRQVAATEIPVIVLGESGTGKEVMTREIHRMSGRNGAFVALNCAAIPEGLIESELFGHAKGAFTGTSGDKRGVVEEAHQGTLLLDEVGDLPAAAQAKLLRLLQDGSFVRVGDTASRRVAVRFVAATNRNLEQMVSEGTFRGDLYARLNGFRVCLPPLRDRKEDLGILTAAFLRAKTSDNPVITLEAFRALLLYDWPYNIREMQKAVEMAMALSSGREAIRLGDFPEPVRAAAERARDHGERGPGSEGPSTASAPASSPRPEPTIKEVKMAAVRGPSDLRDVLDRLLRVHSGNVAAVARRLGTSRTQVHRWMKRARLDPGDFRC